MPGNFEESKHPRDGGKFSSKPGSQGEKKEDNTKVKAMGDVDLEGKSNGISDEHKSLLDNDAKGNPDLYNDMNFDPQMHVKSDIYQKIHNDLGQEGNFWESDKPADIARTEEIDNLIISHVNGEEPSFKSKKDLIKSRKLKTKNIKDKFLGWGPEGSTTATRNQIASLTPKALNSSIIDAGLTKNPSEVKALAKAYKQGALNIKQMKLINKSALKFDKKYKETDDFYKNESKQGRQQKKIGSPKKEMTDLTRKIKFNMDTLRSNSEIKAKLKGKIGALQQTNPKSGNRQIESYKKRIELMDQHDKELNAQNSKYNSKWMALKKNNPSQPKKKRKGNDEFFKKKNGYTVRESPREHRVKQKKLADKRPRYDPVWTNLEKGKSHAPKSDPYKDKQLARLQKKIDKREGSMSKINSSANSLKIASMRLQVIAFSDKE